MAPQSGGRRGSSAEGQGDVLGTTVDTWSASVPGAYAVFFFFSTRRRTRILRSSVLLFGVFANHSHLEFGHLVMGPSYLAVLVHCLGVCLLVDTCSASSRMAFGSILLFPLCLDGLGS